MLKTKKLCECEQDQIVLQDKDGMFQRQISRKMKCSRWTRKTILNRFRERTDVKRIQRTGRKKVTSPRDNRFITRKSIKNRRNYSMRTLQRHIFHKYRPELLEGLLWSTVWKATKPGRNRVFLERMWNNVFNVLKTIQTRPLDNGRKSYGSDENNWDKILVYMYF